MDVELHLRSFVESFVVSARKERWKELFAKRNHKLHRQSHKLHQALDRRYCQVDPVPHGFDWNSMGVYFDFRPEPSLRTFKDVYEEWSRYWNDFVFSLIPGKLAFYFFHEGELFVCCR